MDGIPQSTLDSIPAMAAPPGETSNFVNPPSLFTANLITCYLSIFIALVFFGVRAYTKTFLLKKWYLEDYTCGIAVGLFIAFCGLLNWGAFAGGGRHQWNTSLSMAMNLIYISTIVETVYCMAMLFAKISLLQQIRRIFAVQKGAVYFTTTTLIWMNTLFYFICAFLFTFSCTPREAEWDLLITGHCIDTKVLVVSSSALNILSDVSILIIPVVCTFRLVLPLKRKIGLCVVFATGVFCCGTSVVRLVLAYPLLTAEDAVFLLMQIGLLAVAELVTAIMCSCMPCVPRFISHLRGDTGSTTSSSSAPSSDRRWLNASKSSRQSDPNTLSEKAHSQPSWHRDEEAASPRSDWALPAVASRVSPSDRFGHDKLPGTVEEHRTPSALAPIPLHSSDVKGARVPKKYTSNAPEATIDRGAAPFDSLDTSRQTSTTLNGSPTPPPKDRPKVSPTSPARSSRAVEMEDTSGSGPRAELQHHSSRDQSTEMSPGNRAMKALSGRFWREPANTNMGRWSEEHQR